MQEKINQLNAALADKFISNPNQYNCQIFKSEFTEFSRVDFMGEHSEYDAKNYVFRVISNIASIKDHIIDWSKKNGIASNPDDIINNNKNVAIVHDIWNIDKHGRLNRPPRSGIIPSLRSVRLCMRMTVGPSGGNVSIVHAGNGPVFTSSGDASFNKVPTGDVVDENGCRIGDIWDICNDAIDVWMRECRRLGILK